MWGQKWWKFYGCIAGDVDVNCRWYKNVETNSGSVGGGKECLDVTGVNFRVAA